MTRASAENQKHAGGRPLAFATVADLDLAIQAYFDKQDPHVIYYQADAGRTENGETIWQQRTKYSEQKPYTMAGLARALGVNRRTLLNYKNRDEYFPSIQGAIDRCEEYSESQLFGPNANGAKFSLNNNFHGEYRAWADRQNVDHTTKDQPIPLLAGIAPAKLEVEDDDGGTAQADDGADEDQQS